MYFTYIIECNDKTLYTGICTDPQKRLDTHKKKNQLSAKYTRSHGADRILALWMSDDRIKKLSRTDKLKLISDNFNFSNLIKDLNSEDYNRT